jgi:nitronate monooxygenase
MPTTPDVPLLDAHAAAPTAYPQLPHAPQPIRAHDDPGLWAGQAYPLARPVLAAELGAEVAR